MLRDEFLKLNKEDAKEIGLFFERHDNDSFNLNDFDTLFDLYDFYSLFNDSISNNKLKEIFVYTGRRIPILYQKAAEADAKIRRTETIRLWVQAVSEDPTLQGVRDYIIKEIENHPDDSYKLEAYTHKAGQGGRKVHEAHGFRAPLMAENKLDVMNVICIAYQNEDMLELAQFEPVTYKEDPQIVFSLPNSRYEVIGNNVTAPIIEGMTRI